MPGERDANLAREQYADYLRGLGAHAITVDEVRRSGRTTFAVIAFFTQKPPRLPSTLAVRRGKTVVDVPLLARVTAAFEPE